MIHNARRTTIAVPLLAVLVVFTGLDDGAVLLAPGGRGATSGTAHAAAPEAVLPTGVKAVWDLDTAQREKTATRERVCLNGLWRWQPATEAADSVPDDGWGYFKVPGFWPGNSSYIQEDCQTLYRPSELEGRRPARRHRGLVSARDHRPRGLGRPPHRSVVRST